MSTKAAKAETSKPQPMGPPPELLAEVRRKASDPATEAWAVLLQLFQEHKAQMISLATEYGLSGPPQMAAIRALDPSSEVPMSALAKVLHCDPSNVTGIVDRLEARGLVERRSAPGDRRVKMLALTEQGAKLREQIGERMLRVPDALTHLSRAEQRELRDLLLKAIGE